MSVQRFFFSCQGFFEVRRAKDTEQIPPLLKAIVCEKEASKGWGEGKERYGRGTPKEKSSLTHNRQRRQRRRDSPHFLLQRKGRGDKRAGKEGQRGDLIQIAAKSLEGQFRERPSLVRSARECDLSESDPGGFCDSVGSVELISPDITHAYCTPFSHEKDMEWIGWHCSIPPSSVPLV